MNVLKLINDIQTKGIKCRECRFPKLPEKTFLVWLDTINRRGADLHKNLKDHSVTFEVYEYEMDSDSEKIIESVLDSYNITYTKGDRMWLAEESLYYVPYDFEFIERK